MISENLLQEKHSSIKEKIKQIKFSRLTKEERFFISILPYITTYKLKEYPYGDVYNIDGKNLFMISKNGYLFDVDIELSFYESFTRTINGSEVRKLFIKIIKQYYHKDICDFTYGTILSK